MKKLFVLLFAFASIKVHSQTVDEIVQKYANAAGGLENFKKIKTAKFSGTASAQGNQFPLTVQIINGRAMRTDVDVMKRIAPPSVIFGTSSRKSRNGPPMRS